MSIIQELRHYLDDCNSPYHLIKEVSTNLKQLGFKELSMKAAFNLVPGEKYFVSPSGTSLFAFVMPEDIKSIRIGMGHTDFPTFKLKPVPMENPKAGCNLINVEPYGGSLKKTWFDRPLGIAGAVLVKGEDVFKPTTLLYDSINPMVVIPSIAPHLDKEADKREIDVAKEIKPLCGLTLDGDSFDILEEIAKDLRVKKTDILSFDLNLYDVTDSTLIGAYEDMLQSQKIDNYSSCVALVKAINTDSEANVMPLIALFDNEEIGSRTRQGADSNMLEWVINKICLDSGVCESTTEVYEILANSMMLSCDVAHAVHPSHTEKSDSTSTAYMGKGITIKTSASRRYVTDPEALAIVRGLCECNDISYQVQANKSGTPGGQTLGPLATSYIPIKAADVGIPMLAMHSVSELCAVSDVEEFGRLVSSFFKE